MSISVNKCSYIYAAQRQGQQEEDGVRSNSSNLLLGIGPTIFGDPPSNSTSIDTKIDTSNILQAIYYSKLSHYTHSYLQLSLQYQCMAAITQGKDKERQMRIRRTPSMISFCAVDIIWIDCLNHIQNINMIYVRKSLCLLHVSNCILPLYIVYHGFVCLRSCFDFRLSSPRIELRVRPAFDYIFPIVLILINPSEA